MPLTLRDSDPTAAQFFTEAGDTIHFHVTKLNYHKLPGGGVENDETPVETFKREILEETGCACTIDNENNNTVTLEWKGEFKLFQISYIFLAHRATLSYGATEQSSNIIKKYYNRYHLI